MLSNLFNVFAGVPDPRISRTRLHLLTDILSIAILAVIAGAEGWKDIETYGRGKQSWLKEFLPLPNGIPSHDTFARLFSRIDPKSFQACFEQWVQGIVKNLGVKTIAIDGKTVRGSYDRGINQSALQIVSAWAGENHLVLGQVAVEPNSNEITAIPILLKLLDLEGTIVTIDAAGTQKEIAQQIIQQKGDYVLALKGNQPKLHEAVKSWFKRDIDCSCCTIEAGHHRIERREVWVAPVSVLENESLVGAWAGLQSIAMVTTSRKLWNKTTEGVRFYISSLSADPKQIAEVVRGHWGIENSLHWVLDVTFGEDESRIRKDSAPKNMATIRRFAISLLKQINIGKDSIRTKRYRAGLDNGFMEQIINSV